MNARKLGFIKTLIKQSANVPPQVYVNDDPTRHIRTGARVGGGIGAGLGMLGTLKGSKAVIQSDIPKKISIPAVALLNLMSGATAGTIGAAGGAGIGALKQAGLNDKVPLTKSANDNKGDNMDKVNDAYIKGFLDKCAEAGIDPEELLKQAQWAQIGQFAAKTLPKVLPWAKSVGSKALGYGSQALGAVKQYGSQALGAAKRYGGQALDTAKQYGGQAMHQIATNPVAAYGTGIGVGGLAGGSIGYQAGKQSQNQNMPR